MRSIPKLLFVFAALSIGVAAQTLTTFAVNPRGGASPAGINDKAMSLESSAAGKPIAAFCVMDRPASVNILGAESLRPR